MKVCSAYRIIETSKALMTSGWGTLPNTMWKTFSQKDRPGSGAIGIEEFLSRPASWWLA